MNYDFEELHNVRETLWNMFYNTLGDSMYCSCEEHITYCLTVMVRDSLKSQKDYINEKLATYEY
jgi:hypothetical protein